MSVVARRIRATPERSAAEAWTVIVGLVSSIGSKGRDELKAAAGVASFLIADEAPKEAPIVIIGSGPRLRIYCLYGEDAVTGDGSSEDSLTWNPTDGEWTMWLPTPSEDIVWVRTELAKCSERIVAYEPEEEEPGAKPKLESLVELEINIEAFKKL